MFGPMDGCDTTKPTHKAEAGHQGFFGGAGAGQSTESDPKPFQEIHTPILWMDETLHHWETMGNHCSLVFTGESLESAC